MLPCTALVGLILTAATPPSSSAAPPTSPEVADALKKVNTALDLNSLPPQARAALQAVKIPGVTDPPEDPTAKLPPELVAPWQIALDFFSDVLKGDAEGAVAFSRAPFSFDGHTAANPDEIKKSWARYLVLPHGYHPLLYSLDVYPYEEMVKRYGAPPAKLSDVPFKGSLIAVANVDGRATLAILRKDPGGLWRIYGFSD